MADVDAGMSAGAGVDVGAGLVLPGEEAVGLMEFCGVGGQDREEMLAARPDAVREPEWWAVTAALAESVVREMEMAVPSTGFEAWPAVPMESSAAGLFAGGLGVAGLCFSVG
ncbi:hypothetical protein GCM10009554_02050 [Kribbella koreensis]|uniref:Uncharacterized protein n=2 Tax=Kribbella koreensis TaxID=57909 RepID=A0ABP3ZKR7_9ACTN